MTMIWKTVFIAFLAVGVQSQLPVPKEKLKEELTKYCTANGAADKVTEVENVIKGFIDCLKNLVDVEVLKGEIEAAKPNGAVDEVFKKYCDKSPQLKTCIHTLTNGVVPCLDSTVKSQVTNVNNGTDHLIDFICYKDGDRIALFIAEQGPECFQSKQDEIKTCFEPVKNSFKGVDTVEKAKKMTMKERCDLFDTFSKCVVDELEKCDTPTPGNMAESMLRYVRNGSQCPKLAA